MGRACGNHLRVGFIKRGEHMVVPCASCGFASLNLLKGRAVLVPGSQPGGVGTRPPITSTPAHLRAASTEARRPPGKSLSGHVNCRYYRLGGGTARPEPAAHRESRTLLPLSVPTPRITGEPHRDRKQ